MDHEALGREDRREVFGWMLYMWALHSFETSVATVLFGPYLTGLAQSAVGDNGAVFPLAMLSRVTAKSFFPLCLSFSVFAQVLLLPLLGGIADYTSLKKRMMALACGVGVATTCALYFVGPVLSFRWGGALFALANLAFGSANVLYNAFLPEIVSAERRDAVSSRGYALGYLGGGLALGAHLLLIHFAAALGLSASHAVRLALLSSGLWWGAFASVAFRRLRTRAAPKPLPPGGRILHLGLAEFGAAFGAVVGRPQTLRFLVAYLLFNDGIQTVIGVCAVFLGQELFVARGLPVDWSFIVGNLLMVQFVAFFGSLFFEWAARVLGAKRALLSSLGVWSLVIVYGWRLLETTQEARAMSFAIALVLGGSQALARSMYSRMIPRGREASFFALFEISASGTSWLGPLIFGLVVAETGSYREAVLSLVLLFISGTLLLLLTDTDRAAREAIEPPASRSGRPQGLVRSLLDRIALTFCRFLVHVFFREIDVTGLERIPRRSPLVLVANHTNAVLDAVLLLSVPEVLPRILAKSPLFSHPVMGPLLALVGALPVHRKEDRGAKPSRNRETFARCQEALANGESIALFSEGTSHSHPTSLPLKTGAARIVLESESRRGRLGLRIIPVRLSYEAKTKFRSRVRIMIGAPIDPGVEAGSYARDGRRAVRALTERIGAGLDSATREEPWAPTKLPLVSQRTLPSPLLGLILLVGYALNWLPYRVPGFVAARLSASPDDPATYKLITALVAFPWIGETLIAIYFGGGLLGIATGLLAPATGYAVLRLSRGWI